MKCVKILEICLRNDENCSIIIAKIKMALCRYLEEIYYV